jgi:hypothetical protein
MMSPGSRPRPSLLTQGHTSPGHDQNDAKDDQPTRHDRTPVLRTRRATPGSHAILAVR